MDYAKNILKQHDIIDNSINYSELCTTFLCKYIIFHHFLRRNMDFGLMSLKTNLFSDKMYKEVAIHFVQDYKKYITKNVDSLNKILDNSYDELTFNDYVNIIKEIEDEHCNEYYNDLYYVRTDYIIMNSLSRYHIDFEKFDNFLLNSMKDIDLCNFIKNEIFDVKKFFLHMYEVDSRFLYIDTWGDDLEEIKKSDHSQLNENSQSMNNELDKYKIEIVGYP